MSTRAEILAERVLQGANELIAFIETCSDEEWKTMCPDEERPVGVLAHHVGSAYVVEADVIKTLTAGNGLDVPWSAVDQMNAEHASSHEHVNKEETIELIKKNSAMAADVVRGLSDEQLDVAGPIALNWNAPLTTQFFVEDHAIGHSFRHLASIRDALGR